MVDLAIAKYRAENVARLTRIEDRIIGIDGNGTGKKGAVQILSDKMDRLAESLHLLLTKESETKGALGLRQKYTGWLFTGLAGLVSIGGIILGDWIKHRMGW
jgi:hypothetical protein